MIVFHLALTSEWQDAVAAGSYTRSTVGMSLDDVGFIHCSLATQVDGVHERYYAAVDEPVLTLTIDTDLLTSPWRFDDVEGQPEPFPHVYGPLDLEAVIAVEPMRGSRAAVRGSDHDRQA